MEMTSVYKCNRCGGIMSFEDSKYVILNLGAGRQDEGFENNKVDDLCPACYDKIEDFIENGETVQEAIGPTDQVEEAKKTLKEFGFVVYKPTTHRNKSKK
jgi:hypothetical protein